MDMMMELIQQFKFVTLLDNQNKKLNEIINELPKTYQTPTMAPFCKDEEKYELVDELVKAIENLKKIKLKLIIN
jgi:hypothetical protein